MAWDSRPVGRGMAADPSGGCRKPFTIGEQVDALYCTLPKEQIRKLLRSARVLWVCGTTGAGVGTRYILDPFQMGEGA